MGSYLASADLIALYGFNLTLISTLNHSVDDCGGTPARLGGDCPRRHSMTAPHLAIYVAAGAHSPGISHLCRALGRTAYARLMPVGESVVVTLPRR